MLPPSQLALLPFAAGLLMEARDSLLLEGPSLLLPLASSSASSLLFFNASNKSTRSLHCNSIARSESCNALSVSLRGWYPEGIL